jgi:hypothetical protein
MPRPKRFELLTPGFVVWSSSSADLIPVVLLQCTSQRAVLLKDVIRVSPVFIGASARHAKIPKARTPAVAQLPRPRAPEHKVPGSWPPVAVPVAVEAAVAV